MKQFRSVQIFIVVSMLTLLCINYFNHNLFHFLTEIIIIFIGVTIYIMAVNTNITNQKNMLLSMGIAYLYIGLLDLMHVLTYSDLNIVNTLPYTSESFWTFGRLLEASSILIIFYLSERKFLIKNSYTHIGYFIIVLSMFGIIQIGMFETNTLISINNILGYFTGVLYLLALYFSYKSNLNNTHKKIILISIMIKLVLAILIVVFTKENAFITVAASLMSLVSYLGFYVVFINYTLKDPYGNVYQYFKKREEDLIQLTERDSLTGIYNHSTTYMKVENFVKQYSGDNKAFFVTMIDIDDFKIVNDKYGHQKGDEVLIAFSNLLLESKYGDIIVGRYGGDEFIIAGTYKNRLDTNKRFKNICDKLAVICLELDVEFTFSAGTALYNKGDTAKDLIYKADIKMYESKRLGKNRVSIWE